MTSKKIRTLALGAGTVCIALVIVGGVLQSQSQPHAKKERSHAATAPSAPLITHDNKGVTEISLPSAPNTFSKPDIEKLKEFRTRSEELERTVAALKKEQRETGLTVGIGDVQLHVEPFYTFESQKKGLLGRDSLPEQTGTLYVFQMDDPGRLFGTKGMKFPIDMIWANSNRMIVHLIKNIPPDFEGDLKSPWPAQYVMEVNAGYIDQHTIQVGDTIDLSKVPH